MAFVIGVLTVVGITATLLLAMMFGQWLYVKMQARKLPNYYASEDWKA